MRELKSATAVRAGERGGAERRRRAGEPAGKIVFPPPMAATGAPIRVPVAVACGVLGLSRQGYYQWLASPVSQRDLEDRTTLLREIHDDPLGYRFLADEPFGDVGIIASENRVEHVFDQQQRPAHRRRSAHANPVHRSMATCWPSWTTRAGSPTTSPRRRRTRSG